MDQDAPSENNSTLSPVSTPAPTTTTGTSSATKTTAAKVVTKTEATEAGVNMCEKCDKPFSTMILLKYHYCSHFISVLKKNFEHLCDDNNTCPHCKKTFDNSRRLLLHIGVNHDKINDILRSKGYKELPPHSFSPPQPSPSPSSTSEPTSTTTTSSSSSSPVAPTPSKRSFDIRRMIDVKNIPLLPPPSSSTPAPEPSSETTEKNVNNISVPV